MSVHPATIAEQRRAAAAKRKADWPDPHRSLAEARTTLGTAEAGNRTTLYDRASSVQVKTACHLSCTPTHALCTLGPG
jgi:hypothetical protein